MTTSLLEKLRLNTRNLINRLSFSDRSGGLIVFDADNMETAINLTMNDPFVVNKVIESKWVKEWIQER